MLTDSEGKTSDEGWLVECRLSMQEVSSLYDNSEAGVDSQDTSRDEKQSLHLLCDFDIRAPHLTCSFITKKGGLEKLFEEIEEKYGDKNPIFRVRRVR